MSSRERYSDRECVWPRRVLILRRTICSTQRVNYGQSGQGESRRSSNNDAPLLRRPLCISKTREFREAAPEATDPKHVTVRRSVQTQLIPGERRELVQGIRLFFYLLLQPSCTQNVFIELLTEMCEKTHANSGVEMLNYMCRCQRKKN